MARTQKQQKNQNLQIPVPEFVSSGIENGKARVQDLGSQAESLIKEFYERGNTELESVRDRLHLDDMVDRARDIETRTRDRATEIADDFEERLHDLQDKALGLVGLASRDEVTRLSKEIDRLTRKVNALAKQLKGPETKTRSTSTKKTTTRKSTKKAAKKATR
ncbi:MAG: hypothetical protein P1V51_06555 [Deltaproteobacteria bacterium]|nr:hypothetical protein [Deltaproteobacteria bacterium]